VQAMRRRPVRIVLPQWPLALMHTCLAAVLVLAPCWSLLAFGRMHGMSAQLAARPRAPGRSSGAVDAHMATDLSLQFAKLFGRSAHRPSLRALQALAADLPNAGVPTERLAYCLNVRFKIRPEQREAFLAAIMHDQDRTLKDEPKALQFVVGESTTETNSFFLHEEYVGEDGFKAHLASRHFAVCQAFFDTKPFVEGRQPVVDIFFGDHKALTRQNVPAFCLNVDLFPKPENRAEFVPTILNNKAGADNDEPLCLQYVWGESTTVPNTFHFHEEYTGDDGGKEGFDAHTKAPHFAAWEKFAATSPFTREPVVYFFRTI